MDTNVTNASLFYLLDYYSETGGGSLGAPSGNNGKNGGGGNGGALNSTGSRPLLNESWRGPGSVGGGTYGTDLYPTLLNENYNWTWDNESSYPSGYSQLRIILTSFFVTIIMILIVVGNMLVCIAIATEKTLKTIQNWFIASLAVSDFLLGLVIMPFSLANELMGYWIFGRIWCEIHSALDVLLCTASINNLCLISLDRYWSVTQAVEYLKKRTPSRAIFMICFVWALSALISLPPLVGWKKSIKQSVYPTCELSDDIGYVLYSAFGSFYIPAVVMVFVYIRIFIAARSRARRHVKKKTHHPELTNDPIKDKSTTTTTCTSFSNPSPPEKGGKDEEEPMTPTELPRKENGSSSSARVSGASGGIGSGASGSKGPTVSVISGEVRQTYVFDVPGEGLVSSPRPTPQIVIDTPRESPSPSPARRRYDSNDSNDDLVDEIEDEEENNERTAFVVEYAVPDYETTATPGSVYHLNCDSLKPGDHRAVMVGSPSNYSGTAINVPLPEPTVRTGLLSAASKFARSSFESTMSLADYERADPELRDAYVLANDRGDDDDVIESGRSGGNDGNKKNKKKGKGKVQYQCDPPPPLTGRHTASDAERHKRKVAKARERRATLILGLIMAAFILAWLPFFILYVLEALCSTCYISETGFAVAFWLGYCNSALNPIIYTIFNRDFRRAFRKILFK